MFTIALVGRPNVGKSTLFNRLIGRRHALVDDTPGVTRDRREGEGRLADLHFQVVDTAGLEEADPESLAGRMRAQTERAIADADLVLMMVDARSGIMPLDEHFARLLRRRGDKVVLLANKSEGAAARAGLFEAFSLGLGEPVAISAEHNEGMADLYEAIRGRMPEEPAEEKNENAVLEDGSPPEEGVDIWQDRDRPRVVRMAVVGRPNVGKSTLVNAILGEDRLLTGPEAGITRDAIEVEWRYRDRPLKLVDTAGLRRRARVMEKLEKLSVEDTRRAIQFAHVVVLVLDAQMMLEKQDLTIARMVIEEGRALVIAANKWDAVTDREQALRDLRDRFEISLPQVKGAPYITVSALRGRNLDKLFDAVFAVYDVWNTRISTARLNRWLSHKTEAHPPPLARGRRIRLRYMTQIKARPPTFAAFVSLPEELPEAYTRYLVNGLREDFDLPGTPIRFITRKGKNPYADG
ncbi:MAG: ribosome biogenesis GTPase Der [Pseudomonadota bacterium]|nr:ribosome biogenesis GTPase Der [Pseudomonadota bacterium]MEC8584205.1 ribosome biogenesis GTPase Der [Pseudomonadota bacterium]MEC8676604.1 ribosome biogenesis GTPase Der [Pseudomonadota bacterium]MEC8852097.1 ribosome biogenesis GTPase Der [Pseudomonadota bacterium]MEE3049100.1 ribosome biogenesis GTPase Der [Pseudomonadota bacterium]